MVCDDIWGRERCRQSEDVVFGNLRDEVSQLRHTQIEQSKIIRWLTHVIILITVFRPLIVHDLPPFPLVPEIAALRREITFRLFLRGKVEEEIHQPEHVVGISQQPLACLASSHIEIHEAKRLAGLEEPLSLAIIILHQLFQEDGQEWSCANIVGKRGNVEGGTGPAGGVGFKTRTGRHVGLAQGWR